LQQLALKTKAADTEDGLATEPIGGASLSDKGTEIAADAADDKDS
jgi:hypothetical protein